MPVDPVLCRMLLAVLRDMAGNSMPEDALAVHVETRAGRVLTTVQFKDAIHHCLDKGWIGTREDEWGQDVYWLKDAGKNVLIG